MSATTSPRDAQFIMSENYHGLGNAWQQFGIPTQGWGDTDRFPTVSVPFCSKVLEGSHRNHILVAVPAISIIDITRRTPKLFFKSDATPLWFENEWFARRQHFSDNSDVNWVLLKRESINPLDACTCINYSVSAARELIYIMAMHFLVTGQKLFKDELIRTVSGTLYGETVHVEFGDEGIRLHRGLEAGDREQYALTLWPA